MRLLSVILLAAIALGCGDDEGGGAQTDGSSADSIGAAVDSRQCSNPRDRLS